LYLGTKLARKISEKIDVVFGIFFFISKTSNTHCVTMC
jgi:sulfite exporter TauE/SafE